VRAYYNEHDRRAAEWLRELIRAGLIPAGDVDERSITEIRPHELSGYTHQHFFAGIGGWAYALRLAGWPDSRPVRTGSCPCQPFSCAGLGRGEADERHLWPIFRDLITFGEATTTFGEQVASKAGREWLAGIRADLEGLGYAVGAADLCAAGVGAPHIRQRLYWVADSGHQHTGRAARSGKAKGWRALGEFAGRGAAGGLGNSGGGGLEQHAQCDGEPQRQAGTCGANTDGSGNAGGLGHAYEPGSQGYHERGHRADERTPWAASVAIPCADGKSRRTEPGTFPLAHGIPGRVGLLRGYGNAIVPQVAAQFIQAFDECL